MIRRLKDAIKRRWPPIRLRAILIGVLLFTAAMPGLGAVFLRVYENGLVRQTEAELIAQGAVLEAAFRARWPGGPHTAGPPSASHRSDSYLGEPDLEPLTIDLSSMEILPERPAGLVPAFAPDDRAVATAAVLEPVALETTEATLASIRITDQHGIVVLGRQDKGLLYAHIPEVAAALKGDAGSVIRRRGDYHPRYAFEMLSRASAIRVHYARPIRVDGEVVGSLLLSRSSRTLFRGVYQDMGKIGLGVGVIFLAILGLAGLLNRAITRPIEQLTAATGRVAQGGTDVPETPATATVEIRALFDHFRDMALRIDRRSRYLRDFAAAINHEFKTPLAGIRGALELLEDHGAAMSPAEREKFFGNARADADRLAHLVARLLELARADLANGTEGLRTEIGTPLRRVVDSRRSTRLAVDLVVPDPAPVAAISGEVLETVLATLIDNAAQAGARSVVVSAEGQPGEIVISVADDGPGIAPADRIRLFEPFFTTRRDQGGTGLGLYLSREIARTAGGSLTFRSAPGVGTTFRITLPVVP